MSVANADELTAAVLAVMERTGDPRLREIMTSLVRHLHGFVRDVRLTEDEFRSATALIARLGQLTSDSHNEVVLMAGSLGVSTLVTLLNNSAGDGEPESSASILGPFWRMHSPRTPNGGSLLRSPTPGPPFVFTGLVQDRRGQPVAGAEVDIWHCSSSGFYENQDSAQAPMNLRGKFETDGDGRFSFRSIKPVGYPIPTEGNVVGELLRAQGRHCYRPAHIHALIYKPGFKTLISQVFMPDDPNIDDDVQFAVTRSLIGNLVRHLEPAPGIPDVAPPWYSVDFTFVLEPGEARLPKAPIR